MHRMTLRRIGIAVACLAAWLAAVSPLTAQEISKQRVADDNAPMRTRALDLVNQARAEQGLPPLVLERKLSAAAQGHADDMLMRRYYSHVSPEGKTAADRFIAVGGSKWRRTAENIAECSGCFPPASIGVVGRLHAGWMDSPGHRANILRRGITEFGFGIVVDERKQLYAVETFSGPGLPRGLLANEELTPLEVADQTRQALDIFNKAREEAGRTPIAPSAVLDNAARTILPVQELEAFDLAGRKDLLEAVTPNERGKWESLSVFAADCGGCGAIPTAADVRYFARQWLTDESYRQTMLDADITHAGFAIAANGEGMKVGLLMLGRGR